MNGYIIMGRRGEWKLEKNVIIVNPLSFFSFGLNGVGAIESLRDVKKE
jgi:hypothetical protein